MARREFNITAAARGAAISVKIIHMANRTEIAGIEDDGTVKVRLMSPPVEGQDNEELVHFLANFLGVNQKDIEIIAGLDGRRKLITVLNIGTAEVEQKIFAAVKGEPPGPAE